MNQTQPDSLQIRQFEPDDTEAVVALWEACLLTRPWNDPRADIARKLSSQPELFLVAIMSNQIIGSVMAGYDGHRGWMYYLATSPSHRANGIGRALVLEAEKRLEELGCPKAQLMVRSDNAEAVSFYTSLGYQSDEVLTLGKRLIHD